MNILVHNLAVLYENTYQLDICTLKIDIAITYLYR